jgi:hypothetical protein
VIKPIDLPPWRPKDPGFKQLPVLNRRVAVDLPWQLFSSNGSRQPASAVLSWGSDGDGFGS